MLEELQFRGAVAKGFFCDYEYSVDTEKFKIQIKVGFSEDGGIGLMYSDNTHKIASEILSDEFDLNFAVEIVRDETKAEKLEKTALDIRKKIIGEIPTVKPVVAEKASVVKNPQGVISQSESSVISGYMDFDITEPELIFGEDF